MKQILVAIIVSAAFGLSSLAMAAEATKLDRVGEGASDAVTSPGKIVDGISKDTKKHGPVVGMVTGTVKGTAAAAGQAARGAANVGVGAVEAILSPITGD